MVYTDLTQVLAAIASPGDGKFHAYGAGRYAIHVGSPDFRAAAYAACSQNEAEAFLAEVYVSVLRQFIIAVSELQGRRATYSPRAFMCMCA